MYVSPGVGLAGLELVDRLRLAVISSIAFCSSA